MLAAVFELIVPARAATSLVETIVAVVLGASVFAVIDYLIDEYWGDEGGTGLLAAVTLDGDALADTLVSINALDRVCIGSFSDTRLDRLALRFNDRICTSCGPMDVMRLRIASWGIPVKPSRRARCVQIPVRQYGVQLIDQRFLDYCDTLGWPVHVWTVNDLDEMVWLLDMGVNGLMSDETQRLKALLEHRGQWTGGQCQSKLP